MEIIDLTPKPKLRQNIEVMPLGNGKFALRDIVGFTEETLVLNEVSVLILSLLDGRRTPTEIRKIMQSSLGFDIPEDELNNFINLLDEKGFLDSLRFRSLKTEKIKEFSLQVIRKPNFAGRSYPEGGKEAEEFFEAILSSFSYKGKAKKLLAILSPHIEIVNGVRIYGAVWSFVRDLAAKPDIFFVFGTSHPYSTCHFIPTEKDFETPFGILKNAKEISSEIRKIIGDGAEDEIIHKSEHSIEFQSIFIKYLFPNAKIVPILCPSSWMDSEEGKKRFLDTLHLIKERIIKNLKGTNYILVSAGDLAHIGTRFGDPPVTQYDVSLVRLKDIISLVKFAENKAEEFLESINFDRNAIKVCGVSPTYVLLKLIDDQQTKGEVLGWDIWVDETLSAVSFGAAYIEKT